ncbi:MAG: hypothetical protein EXQ91_01665 [Alphaproteobacteria bacterium]|nr:hypothetical protein [Alphaproteobacteria bacterium]
MVHPQAYQWPEKDFSRVPYSVFVDPEIFTIEQERIFHGPVWSYACLEAEIANPGDFLTTYIGDTPVVVVRADDRSLHAFVNRCAHRGTLLVRSTHGNARDFTCVYHHWCYDQRGKLIGIPFLRGLKGKGGMPPEFKLGDHSLRTLRTAAYRGVVFVTFRDDTESLHDYLDSPMRRYLDDIFAKPIEIIGYVRQRIPCNWKLYYENLLDDYHGVLLHKFLVTFGLSRATQKGGSEMDRRARHRIVYVIPSEEDTVGTQQGYAETTLLDEGLYLRDPSINEYREEMNDRRAVLLCAFFPNLLVQRLSNTLATRQIRPRSAKEYELYWTFFGYADDDPAMQLLRKKQINLVGPGGLVSMEDGEAGRLLQLGINGDFADAHSILAMGGRGEIPLVGHDLLTESSVRGFWRYWCDLTGIGPQTGISAPGGVHRAAAAE